MTRATRAGVALALLLFAAVTAIGLAVRPVLPVDETRYLTVAWEMWSQGSVLVPRLNGAPYSHKPPLLFWLIDLAWAAFGVSALAARLVPALFGLGAIALTAVLARLLWPGRPEAAGHATLALAGMALFALFGGLVMFDAMLAFFTLLGTIAVIQAWRRGGRRWWALYGVALGLALLAKGPVAFVHLLPVPLLAPLWQRAHRCASWRRWYGGFAAGIGLGVAIALAWAMPAMLASGGAFGPGTLWHQTAGRTLRSFAHAQPWWFYLALLPVVLFPWAVWPPAWRALRRARGEGGDDGLLLCLTWAGAAVAVLSLISGKQIHYLLPALPAVALGLGRVVHAEQPIHGAIDLLLPAAIPVALGFALIVAPDAGQLAFPRLIGCPAPDWLGAVDATSGAVLIVGVATLALATTLRLPLALAGAAAQTALLLGAVHLALAPILADRYDLAPVAAALAARERQGIALVGEYRGEFGFLGRLTAPVEEIDDSQVADWLARHAGGVVAMRERDRPPEVTWAPDLVHNYRSDRIGLWRADEPATAGRMMPPRL